MLPTHTDEQKMLQDTVDRFLVQTCPPKFARTAPVKGSREFSDVWQRIADLGLLGLLASESDGGIELGACEAAQIGERMGAHVFPLPFGPSAVLSAEIARRQPDIGLDIELMAGGGLVFAWLETTERNGSYLIDHFSQCDQILVTRELPDGGLGVGVLDVADLDLTPVDAMDPCCPLAELVVDDAMRHRIDLACDTVLSAAMAREVLGIWRLYRLAELQGAMRGGFTLTLEYIKEREQFGTVIGSYQALKHRMADMSMALDAAGLSLVEAARKMDDDGFADDPQNLLDCAHLAVFTAFQLLEKEIVQMHGAFGFTWESDAHLYLKRMLRLRSQLPDIQAYEAIAERYAREVAV